MTPAARVQAAIECLDLVLEATRGGGAAADTVIQRYFTARRYAGSKDRRAVRDLVFDVIRSVGETPPSGRSALIGHARVRDPELLTHFGAAGHAPAAIAEDETGARTGLAAPWLMRKLRDRFDADAGRQVAALLGRAPLDLRVNRLKGIRDSVLPEFPDATATTRAPDGIRLAEAVNIATHPLHVDGLIEVQDEGSQLAALAVGAAPGETVVDLCAGAGGKTLALAAMMDNRGRLVATDADRNRLSAMPPRLERAGVTIVESRLLNARREWDGLADLEGRADRVMVDAPCSGSGTWRRNPEGRWRLTAARLARLTAEQDRLLALAAQLVKPGGSLTYVTCSLLPEEGEARVAAFLAVHPEFAPDAFSLPGDAVAGAQRVLTPLTDGCDGFFIARLTRLC